MAKVKGSALVEVVKFLRSQGEAGRRATPEAQRHYLEERVLPASWYPEQDLLVLLRAMVQFLPGDRESALANAGRFSARTHSEGVYAHLLAPTDDPLSKLVSYGVKFRSGTITPADINAAVDVSSEQGWRRPLLAWLGVQEKRAEAAGDKAALEAIRRRIALVSGKR